ncbi:MAG: hypothetical protein PHR35_14630 [Kiritimatiellae bacterium]|nr:hypothetical protein [Kiritimatiellia bacterium]
MGNKWGGCSLLIQASSTVVEGLTFSGTNGVIDAIRLWQNDGRVANCTFLDLTNSSGTYIYGIWVQGLRNVVVSNRFSRLGTGTGAHALAGYVVSSSNRFEYNQIDTVNSGGSAGPLSINGSFSWVRFNVISNVTRQSGAGYIDCYGISVSQSDCVIEGNTIYGPNQWGAQGTIGINCGAAASAQRGTVANNRLIQCRVGVDASNAVGTNNVVANNHFLWCGYGARPRYSSQNMYSNNVFVGGYSFYTEAAYSASNNWVIDNCLLNCFGPNSGINAGKRQFWSGNFYATGTAGNQTNGTALIPPVAIGADTDAAAVTGFWARAFLPTNTAGIVVEHPSNRNSQNQTTKLVYDTTASPSVQDTNMVGGVLFDVHSLLHATTNGLPAMRANGMLARTLRVTHMFPDGTCMYSMRVAYNPDNLPFRNAEMSAQLYRFNMQAYPNWYWQPAVEGNVVNKTFPANDILRVDGPPDGVLGHYGVDTAQHVVWANLNYIGDFIVTVQQPPTGTTILIR